MKHTVKHAAGLLLFLAGFLIIGKGLRFGLIKADRLESVYWLKFQDLYQQKDIDTVFVGTSHCFCSIDTAAIDRELDSSSFNAGTPAQNLDGSLMLIQEIAKSHKIKHVYLEMYYKFKGYTRRDRSDLSVTYYISDNLKPSVLKYLYMLRAANPEQYIYFYFPMRREWESLFDLDQVRYNIINKNKDNHIQVGLNNGYVDKGFISSQQAVTNWNYFKDRSTVTWYPSAPYSEDWREDLLKIIRFCKDNQIELTLFSSPISDYHLVVSEDYDSYITALRTLLEGTNVSYWDFNLCKEEYFPSNSAFYQDDHHLNTEGAEIFSTLFAKFIKGEISPEELFYDSYEEKLHNLEPNVLGITYQLKNGDAGTTFRSCHIVSIPIEGMEYQIIIQPDDSDPYQIQDYGWNTDFPLEDGAGKIIIRWRVKGKPEYTGERIIDFPVG